MCRAIISRRVAAVATSFIAAFYKMRIVRHITHLSIVLTQPNCAKPVLHSPAPGTIYKLSNSLSRELFLHRRQKSFYIISNKISQCIFRYVHLMLPDTRLIFIRMGRGVACEAPTITNSG